MHHSKPAGELVELWRSGDQAAAGELHRRYSKRLYPLAERQLGERLRARLDADDVLQSVFRTFFRRTGQGEYPIEDSNSLWSLLVKITLNKVRKKAEYHRAANRNVSAELGVESEELLPETIARGPSPADALALMEELEVVVGGLHELDLRRKGVGRLFGIRLPTPFPPARVASGNGGC